MAAHGARCITYDTTSRPLSTTYANGAVTSRSYAPERGWLASLTTTLAGTSLMALTYGRDNAGRILTVTSGAGAADNWSYGYSDLDFLTSASNGGNASLSQSFTYDSAGQHADQLGIGELHLSGVEPAAAAHAADGQWAELHL